jgi:hypothetical protein
MTGDVECHRAEIQHCRGKILLAKVFDPAKLFDLSGNGGSVISGDIKFFDNGVFLNQAQR